MFQGQWPAYDPLPKTAHCLRWMSKTKRVNFPSRLSTCQDIRLKNAPKNGATSHLEISGLLNAYQVMSSLWRPLHVKLTTPSYNLIFVQPTRLSTHRNLPFLSPPSRLLPGEEKNLMMKNQNVEIKMPHLDVPGIFSKWLLVNGVEFHLILRFKRDFTTVISSDDSNLLLPSSNIQSHSKHQVEQFWNLRFEFHSDFR